MIVRSKCWGLRCDYRARFTEPGCQADLATYVLPQHHFQKLALLCGDIRPRRAPPARIALFCLT